MNSKKKRVKMGRRTTGSIQGIKGEDNKSTSSCSSKKRGKISSGNWCIRTCNRRSLITRIGWQMETYRILIKNNATSGTKLWDIWQELLVVVEAITKWRQYLLDVTEKFEVWTDHENLKYFRELHKLNG